MWDDECSGSAGRGHETGDMKAMKCGHDRVMDDNDDQADDTCRMMNTSLHCAAANGLLTT